MKKRRQYKARLLYFFKCTQCGRENSQTYKRRRQQEELCRNCRRHKADPNQTSLFEDQVALPAPTIAEPEPQTPSSKALSSQPGEVKPD